MSSVSSVWSRADRLLGPSVSSSGVSTHHTRRPDTHRRTPAPPSVNSSREMIAPPCLVFDSTQHESYLPSDNDVTAPRTTDQQENLANPAQSTFGSSSTTDKCGYIGLDESQICESCLSKPATVYCISCSGRLCDQCDKQIHSNQFLSRHARVPFNEYRAPVICSCQGRMTREAKPTDISGVPTQLMATFSYAFGRGTETSFVDSTVHRAVAVPENMQASTYATHFCVDCGELLCSSCAVSPTHAGHKIFSVIAAAETVLNDEVTIRDTLVRRAGDLQSFIADMDHKRGAVDKTVESAHSEVKEVFAELHRKLEAAEKAAHGAVSTWHSNASLAVDSAKNQLSSQLNEIYDGIDKLNSELQLGTPCHPMLVNNAAGNLVQFWLREGEGIAALAQRDTAVGALHLQFSTNELREAAAMVASTIDDLTV